MLWRTSRPRRRSPMVSSFPVSSNSICVMIGWMVFTQNSMLFCSLLLKAWWPSPSLYSGTPKNLAMSAMVTALFCTNWASELFMEIAWYSMPRSSTAVRKPFPGPAWILSHSRRM